MIKGFEDLWSSLSTNCHVPFHASRVHLPSYPSPQGFMWLPVLFTENEYDLSHQLFWPNHGDAKYTQILRSEPSMASGMLIFVVPAPENPQVCRIMSIHCSRSERDAQLWPNPANKRGNRDLDLLASQKVLWVNPFANKGFLSIGIVY